MIHRYILLGLYYGLLQWLPSSRRLGGMPGRLRYYCCRRLFAACGTNVNIERRAFFGSGSTLRIGDDSGIGVSAKLSPNLTIGSGVLMGEDVLFLTRNHAYKNAEQRIGEQGYYEAEEIVIEDDVWIGTRVIILPGVHMAIGSVAGAGAVVTKSVPPYAVVAGNPARVLAHRQ